MAKPNQTDWEFDPEGRLINVRRGQDCWRTVALWQHDLPPMNSSQQHYFLQQLRRAYATGRAEALEDVRAVLGVNP